MTCRECEPLISEWVDGDLDAARAAEVAAHVEGCAACGRARAETVALIEAARGLDPKEAPPALWTRLSAELDSPPPVAWWRRRWIIPSLAGAALALAVVGGVAMRKAPAPSDDALLTDAQVEFRAAESHYLRAIADLRVVAGREREAWPEPNRKSYDEALAALDAAAEKCRGAARAHPTDPETQELLYGAYRHEIAFLEESLLRAGR